MNKNTFLVLALVYLSFIALGLPDGAFGVAWPGIRYEMSLPLGRAGIVMIVHSVFYSLASSQLGRISRKIKLEHIGLLGLGIMSLGFFGYVISPGFILLIAAVAVTGGGMGMVDSSFNSYMAKNFTSRYMNWLHCFWGLGAALSPLIIARMIMVSGWRAGYAVLAAFHAVTALIVLVSMFKKVFAREEGALQAKEKPKGGPLFKKRHQFLVVFICFIYIGVEHALGFWITSVMMESRGMSHDRAALFPAVYFAMVMAGRFIAGYLAKWVRDRDVIRFGLALSLVGVAVLVISDNILGMALAGLGLAPIFPCVINETSNRFAPHVTTKLVGYEIASIGAGVAIISNAMGQLLTFVSLEALFPASLALITAAFVFYEILITKSS